MTHDPVLAAMIRRTIAIAKADSARRMLRTSDYSKAKAAAEAATHSLLALELRQVVRRDPIKSAEAFHGRFQESFAILAGIETEISE